MPYGTSIHAQAQSPAHIAATNQGSPPMSTTRMWKVGRFARLRKPQESRLKEGPSSCLPRPFRLLRASEPICESIAPAPTLRRQGRR